MLEMLLCSLVTILPDYLFRRYRQGKRFGKEITLYSVWYELRYGITTCVILTVCLILVIFYNHPSTTSATLFFRTVPILPETNGRVAEIYINQSDTVAQGAPVFRLDSTKQQAAVETARRKINEVDAAMIVAQAEIQKAEAQLREAKSNEQQVQDELDTKRELHRRNPGIVPLRDIERLEVRLDGAQGGVAASTAAKRAAEIRVSGVLPAEKASAEAELAHAQVDTRQDRHPRRREGTCGAVLSAGRRHRESADASGRILIPEGAGSRSLQAGFDQIEAQIMKVGMIAEVTCISKPWTIIPMVVTDVQDVIAAGQFRGGENLVEARQVTRPGTLLVYLEPLYKSGLDGVTPGSSCIANAYSNNHDIIAAKETGFFKGLALHAVDALGLVHALILRIQALLLPFKTLVFSGH